MATDLIVDANEDNMSKKIRKPEIPGVHTKGLAFPTAVAMAVANTLGRPMPPTLVFTQTEDGVEHLTSIPTERFI